MFIFFLSLLTVPCLCVEIQEMSVPSVLESGRESFAILDCDYILSESEAAQMDLKWFFGDDPQPFYQWIPGRKPQAIGDTFTDRLDLDYQVPDASEYHKHRAIKIINPTTELSGNYKCKISSLIDEDFMTKKMVVYAPAQDVSLIYTKPDSSSINLTCSAKGVFPEPEVKLSWGPSVSGDHSRTETTTLTVERDGLFDVTVYKRLNEEDLQPETVFGCKVAIPGTTYSVKEETMYFPGKVLYQKTASSSARWTPVISVIIISCLVAISSRQ